MKLIITTFFLLNAVSSFHVPPSYTNNKKQQHKQLNAVPLEIDPGITIPIIALGGLVLAFAKNNSTEMSSIITAKSSSKTTTTTKKQEKVATKKQMKKIEKGSNERPEKSLKYWEDVFRVEEEVMGLPVEKEVFESLTTMKPATTVIVVDETVGAIASEESSRSKTSLFAKSNNTYDDDIENVDDMGRIQYSATEENEEVKSQQQKSIEEEETVTANDTNADAETAEEKEEETTTPIAATDTISSKETETKNDEKTSFDSYKFQRALLEAQLRVEKKRITTTSPEKEDEDESALSSFDSLLISRRTINDFETELPDGWEASLENAIRTASYAPNHKRTEPWRFHLLGPKSIRKVCELNAEMVTEKSGKEKGEKKLKRWLNIPGWLVVTCNGDSDMEKPNSLAREDYAACCCAVQNLSLSLHSEGLGTKWTTGDVNFDTRFANAVGLSDNEYVVGTIWFGKAARVPPAPIKKLSMDDIFIKHD